MVQVIDFKALFTLFTLFGLNNRTKGNEVWIVWTSFTSFKQWTSTPLTLTADHEHMNKHLKNNKIIINIYI